MKTSKGIWINVLCGALAMFALQAHAGDYIVTRHDDPAPDGCRPDDCSLREAVIASNANPGQQNTIEIGEGSYGLPFGRLEYTGRLRVLGSGAEVAQIEGNGEEAVFYADADDARIELHSMTLQGHGAPALDASYGSGGGALLYEIAIDQPDSKITMHGSAPSASTFQVVRSHIESTVECTYVGLCQFAECELVRLQLGLSNDATPQIEIHASTIDGDFAPSQTSGVVIQTANRIDIDHSEIRNTNLGLRIGVAAPSHVTLDHVKYIANETPFVQSQATDLSIDASEFRDNTAIAAEPGALRLTDPGAIAVVTNSSFVHNVGNGAIGGAILVEDGASLAVRNSTFSGNTFTVDAASSGARGGAIGYRDDADTTTLTLQHVTIVAPAFMPVGISGSAIGGLGAENGLGLAVLNSIIRGTCALQSQAMDVALGNIESGGDTCDFSSGSNHVDVDSDDLALDDFGDHGGATPTYMLVSNSVAIDAADPDYCLATDQRGYPRPFGGACDVGAVEADADVLFADGFD